MKFNKIDFIHLKIAQQITEEFDWIVRVGVKDELLSPAYDFAILVEDDLLKGTVYGRK